MLKEKIEKLLNDVKKFTKRRKKEVCAGALGVVLLGGIGVGVACMNGSVSNGVATNDTKLEISVDGEDSKDNVDKDNKDKVAVEDTKVDDTKVEDTETNNDDTNTEDKKEDKKEETTSATSSNESTDKKNTASNSGSSSSNSGSTSTSTGSSSNNKPSNGSSNTSTNKPSSGSSNSSSSSNSGSTSKPSSGSSSSGSSSNSGSSNNNTSKPSTGGSSSSEHTHTHNWVAVTSTVHHDEEGHWEDVLVSAAWTEEVPVYEEKELSICNTCGADITGNTSAHMKNHMLNGENGSFRTEWRKVQTGTNKITHDAVYEKKWVVDKAAWDETVTTGYKCSGCGATK